MSNIPQKFANIKLRFAIATVETLNNGLVRYAMNAAYH